ncbi:MAG: thiamine diphosphokinase [Ignavibacteriae bacterium]|nr:MAG: thiamine diphosphokinase [Ignavibacteriota bacterium]
MKRALILANGKSPSKLLFHNSMVYADWFVCADGGANTAARFGYTPDLIIGDLDSIEKETLKKFSSVKTIKLKDQNSTDLEKALTAVLRKKFKEIIVLGATGGRLDHAIGNLSALAKYSDRAHITFLDIEGIFISVDRILEMNLPAGTIISLLPLSRCTGVITRGLKWNLNGESLELGIRESTSNVMVTSPVTIKVKKGRMIAFVMANHTLIP